MNSPSKDIYNKQLIECLKYMGEMVDIQREVISNQEEEIKELREELKKYEKKSIFDPYTVPYSYKKDVIFMSDGTTL